MQKRNPVFPSTDTHRRAGIRNKENALFEEKKQNSQKDVDKYFHLNKLLFVSLQSQTYEELVIKITTNDTEPNS